MLFKDKYFDSFRCGIAGDLRTFSQNSALSVLAVWDCVRSHFYDIDFGGLVETLRRGLPSKMPFHTIPFDISQDVLSSVTDKRLDLLSAHFYSYFFVRLPVLFRWNRLIHMGKKRRLSRKEMDAVVRTCITDYAESYGEVGGSLSPDEYMRFLWLARWCVRRKSRDDEVYSIQWLWGVLGHIYPDIMAPTNTGSITNHVIESCFPMFWDTLQERYRNSMVCYANLGWFVGDADLDEIEMAMRSSNEKSTRG